MYSNYYHSQEQQFLKNNYFDESQNYDDQISQFSPIHLGNQSQTLSKFSPTYEESYHYYPLESAQYENEQKACSEYCKTANEHCLSCLSREANKLSFYKPHDHLVPVIKKRIQKSKYDVKPNSDFSIRKNFPKLLGNHFLAYLDQFLDEKFPDPIAKFKEDAQKMKKSKKQLSFAIQDFSKLCLASEETKSFFIHFLLFKFPVRLNHSIKFTQIELALDLISNAYVGACNPEKWKGNKQITNLE